MGIFLSFENKKTKLEEIKFWSTRILLFAIGYVVGCGVLWSNFISCKRADERKWATTTRSTVCQIDGDIHWVLDIDRIDTLHVG